MRLLGHRRLATGVFLRFDRRYLFDGLDSHPRDVVRHPGGIAVLPVDGDRLWLVEQFRTAIGDRVLEVPAGKRDPSDRDPLVGAKRELAEELGAEAEDWIFLARALPSPGYTDEELVLYAARGLTFRERKPQGLEEDDLRVAVCSVDEALDRIAQGEIIDAKTQIAILLWARKRSTL